MTLDLPHGHGQVDGERTDVHTDPPLHSDGFGLTVAEWRRAVLGAVIVIAFFYAMVLLGATLATTMETPMKHPSEATGQTRQARHLERRSDGLKVAEAAKRLDVHEQTVRNWINAGTLPVTRFGPGRGVIRIHPDDLQEYAGGR